ncbi:MAG: serine hydrolase [Spirochaetales bacterium]|nr:serine hydrolase [Spirochaetales bacterium]
MKYSQKITAFCIILPVLLLFTAQTPQQNYNAGARIYIEQLIEPPGIPALACLVIRDSSVLFTDAAGVRYMKGGKAVNGTESFHIGSNSKAVTALLAAILVDEDKLRWDSTIGDILTGSFDTIPDIYRNITLEQLLSHTAGIMNDITKVSWSDYFFDKTDIRLQRRKMAGEIMQNGLLFEPGTDWAYSNFGYVLAGLILETVADASWEDLVRKRIFVPLGMKSAGFGPSAHDDREGQPWGHNPGPIDPAAIGADNPVVLGPAGTIHAGLNDLAQLALLFCNEGNYPREKPLISRPAYDKIIKPALNRYALGWFSYYDGSLQSQVLTHDGSNTMFYSTLNVYPDRNDAVVVLCNSGTAATSKTGWKVGDPITNLTSKGNTPAWTTVRQRFWKNEAFLNPKSYSAENLLRMQKGLAPQQFNPATGLMESMELHHIPPMRDGGLFEFIKVWPSEHAAIDPFRHLGN